MSMPSQPPRAKRVWDDPRVVVPPDSEWMAMSPDERDAAFERIRAVFEEYGHQWTGDPGVDVAVVGQAPAMVRL